MGHSFRHRSRTPRPARSQDELDAMVRRMKSEQQHPDNYRDHSLRIHGLICAKCAREFDASHVHLLTVHHKDGNHRNNPADGSNWENLCIDCHDDEHQRSLLADYLYGPKEKK
ncbi:MAG: HNH endonuclease [Desulfuromonas sp.]|nr:MAG: HNH endonuclease [Desulfuromonas sp.]